MDDRWNSLPQARRVLQHADDARPAWLWSQDGQTLLWSNAASGLFGAKIKKHGIKREGAAIPIKGQVARIIRLGSDGRTSLARIQFNAGEKPVSATCATTPLTCENDQPALLIVAVDPIAADILATLHETKPDHPVVTATPAVDEAAAHEAAESVPADDTYQNELESWRAADAETAYDAAEIPSEPVTSSVQTDEPEQWVEALGDTPLEKTDVSEDQTVARAPLDGLRRLSALVDRLADDEDLYTPLGEEDDFAPAPAVGSEDDTNEPPLTLFKVTGRGFLATEPTSAEPVGAPTGVAEDGQTPFEPEADVVERVSRYNFDELSRILTDRVGAPAAAVTGKSVDAPAASPGALVNLGGETLVLNRLPLGILVFRDQQVLFANRSITEMLGYETVESLRQAGLASIFPVMGGEGQEAGPVNHLVQRDGTLVPVTARLQSISWHGRPALMLSASTTEVRTGHEDAVKAFAQSFADIRGDGFFEASRVGVVSGANAAAVVLLSDGKPVTGRALSSLVAADDTVALRAFLDRPARFAETSRPCLNLRSVDGKADLLLFALGQAGIISGYFGFARRRETMPARSGSTVDVDPALLSRISRGVRQPLNTIVGFSDLIRSKAFGSLGSERYEGYADDIARAGQEIAALVDELDDYARLRDGRYLPQRASLDLTSVLESCVVRIRGQANGARVIVRNAISQSLPRVTADRASLAQAVLNLLASAIDQTPVGGTVVISAQRHEDGAIAIHVRDGSAQATDMAERFVVFRDGVDRSGQLLAPVRSSVGLALTRSLLAVNAVSLQVDPAGAEGMLFTLRIPADLVDEQSEARDAE